MIRRIHAVASVVWLEAMRRKDAYVLFILAATLLGAVVSLNAFGLGNAARYILDLSLVLAWVFGWILAISITCRQLPREEARGTLFPLLAKPLSRAELLIGKWIGAWSISCVATVIFYTIAMALTLVRGGSVQAAVITQGLLLHCLSLAIVSAVALLFTTRMTGDAAVAMSSVTTIASFLVVPRIPEFAARAPGLRGSIMLVLYHVLPHMELFDMRKRIVHGYGPIDTGTFLLVTGYAVALVAALLLLSWFTYRNRRFSREALD